MPASARKLPSKPPVDSDFGDIVHDRAWKLLRPTFEKWARAEEEKLRGYRMREIRFTFQSSEPVRRMHMERAERMGFDPGRFRADSRLCHVTGGAPGEVRVGLPPRRPPEVIFTANLPTQYLVRHPEAEAVVREAIEHASKVTGLRLQGVSDVRGGSNWVISGGLAPAPAPVADVADEPEDDVGLRP